MLLDAMYVCSSPFQILTAVILASNNCEKADIYINRFFKQVDRYVERLRLLGVFRDVFVIPYDVYSAFFNKKGRLTPKLQAFHNYLFPNKIAESVIPSKCFYKKIYSPNRDIICRYLQFYHFKHNYNTELIIYEEGNSVYIRNDVIQENLVEKMLRKAIYGNYIKNNTLLLYSPSLFQKMKQKTSFEIDKIAVPSNAIEIIKEVFNFQYAFNKGSAILIDTHKSAIFNKSEKNRLEMLYRTIIEALQTTVYLKKHPRETEISFVIDETIDDSVPFEVLCTDSNADNFVLVSYISTAVATPKLMFNKEPYVILLYKLVNSNLDISDLDNYYRAFKQLYCYPERICIPVTVEELMNYISVINSKFHQ